jgi:flagellar motility protein MotE (MotC chaperone)
MTTRDVSLRRELDHFETLDAPSSEQVARAGQVVAELAWLDREHEREAAELLEQEHGRKRAERDRAEAVAAFNRQRAERGKQEQLLIEATELRRRADELEAAYRAGVSWTDAHAAAVAATPARAGKPTLADALQSIESKAAAAGLDSLSDAEAAGLLAAAGVKPRTIRKWRIGRMREDAR